MSDDTRQVAELRIHVTRLEGRLETLEERIEGCRNGVDRNAKEIERIRDNTSEKLDSFDDELSVSKVHMLNEIKAERDELAKKRSDSGIWWKRTSIGWVVAAVGALVMAAAGVVATLLLHR